MFSNLRLGLITVSIFCFSLDKPECVAMFDFGLLDGDFYEKNTFLYFYFLLIVFIYIACRITEIPPATSLSLC